MSIHEKTTPVKMSGGEALVKSLVREGVEVVFGIPGIQQLEEAASAIMQSRLPVIVAGGGVALSGAEQALLKLVEASNIPVVTSGGGKGAIPDSHPLCYGSCVSLINCRSKLVGRRWRGW